MVSSPGGAATPSATNVVVKPGAFCPMILHSVKHKTTVVHGLLLGSFDSKEATITVKDAVPVCHSTPTLPLIETAIGLVEVSMNNNNNNNDTAIIGWYTAPMLLEDTKPGPVAMRIATSLEKGSKPSTLLVLNNAALTDCFKGNFDRAKDAVQAYGKDFGKQFQEPITTTVEQGEGASKALVNAREKMSSGAILTCNDLEDNMENPSSIWYPNKPLNDIVASACP